MSRPNILFLMTDQQRFDTIAALGNMSLYTPNLDRLVNRGIAFTNAYTTCPECVPARAIIRTGCEPTTTGIFWNAVLTAEETAAMETRCGSYLAQAMAERGYRTFGIGKFHTNPWDKPLGYETHLHSEELYATPEQRAGDAYAAFLAREHPEFAFVEMLMGERTEMYYMPQASPLPAGITVEAWAANRAVEQIAVIDSRPFFGKVSFIGPHPPFAPPIPFNRMYDPDTLPGPILADLALDHMDAYIPWMNHLIWAEEIPVPLIRTLKARYYGEITYIDHCIGRILDAVERRPDADNTLICFFSDHGEHLGDHHAWQKESFFEASCRIPFLLSWPERIPGADQRSALVCLTDLFGIATTAAGTGEIRDGHDVLDMVLKGAPARERLFGYYGPPGQREFKIMVREGDWKYIYLANGGREQLFQMAEDPNELRQRLDEAPEVAKRLRALAIQALRVPSGRAALDGDDLRTFPFQPLERQRVYQFDGSRGVYGFPRNAADVWKATGPV